MHSTKVEISATMLPNPLESDVGVLIGGNFVFASTGDDDTVGFDGDAGGLSGLVGTSRRP